MQSDGFIWIDYVDWWRERVAAEEVVPNSANKSMGMLKKICIRRRVKIPEVFRGLRLPTGETNVRSPYDLELILIIATAGTHAPGELPPITYVSSGLEEALICRVVCDILEGGERAFRSVRAAYA
ncbi:hypothetical protein FBZ96_12212 [Bradyrhizobium stylosanthis]|uniref:Uncharacterized protein n=1 Tax=Bradyrhizobium stylosanthis TaxID=1803665 RepID=A0A560CVX4_9BRAD|nr:hypothetical protein [Bradyrhizobium stylosanthis]TWA88996.1 hypothetical protein FBZ96_12212 [Bradyrhizobium stylosanthis]